MENTADLLKSQLEIDSYGANHLSETAKWGKFLAIIGFVGTGIIVLAGLYLTVATGSSSYYSRSLFSGFGPVIGIVYIVLGVLYFFPSLFLYRFSTNMKTALALSDQEMLNESLNQQRRMFKFVGILTIIVIGLYVLLILLAILGAAFS